MNLLNLAEQDWIGLLGLLVLVAALLFPQVRGADAVKEDPAGDPPHDPPDRECA